MKDRLKILIVENDPYETQLIQDELNNSNLNYTIEIVKNLHGSEEIADNFHPDIVLSNYKLFLLNGEKTPSGKSPLNPDVPYILIDDNNNTLDSKELIKKGISDIIQKKDMSYLIPKIKEAIMKVEEIKDINNTSIQLQELKKEFELFSSFLSHDLRAPLRIINGYMKMIEEDKKNSMDEECMRIVEIVHNNAKKATELMDDLLAFSRIMTRELNINTINTSELVSEVISDLKASLSHNPEIIKGNLETVTGDFSLIYLMFSHLISNAIKFSSKVDKPKIEIHSKKENNEIIFSVTDNGIGMDPDLISKLFTGFHRLHDPAEYEGTGMGLAIVNRIVTKHKGTVWMKSEPNKGATIYCSFPDEK